LTAVASEQSTPVIPGRVEDASPESRDCPMCACTSWFDDSSGQASRGPVGIARKFFIIFVDAAFTTLFERLFTNVFDVIGAKSANHCLCRACNAD